MQKRVCFSILAALWVTTAQTVRADQEVAPAPYVATASDLHRNAAAFTMVPPEIDPKTNRVTKPAVGVAYRLQPDGSLLELYRVEGWYSQESYISPDGRYLVRMGPWIRGRFPSHDDLAVAFYVDGKLVKKYSTVDLLKDPSKVIATSSHYNWRGRPLGDSPWHPLSFLDKTFLIFTIDGWKYRFDLTTGEIVSAKESRSSAFNE